MAEKKEKRYVSDNAQLMAEWDWEKNNELGLFPDRLTCGSNKKVWWKCLQEHQWEASINSRTMGRNCPKCSIEKGTSFPEQTIYYYVSMFFDCENRYDYNGFELDIFIPKTKTAIEYDGKYYHSSFKKQKRDEEKTLFLQKEGVRLIRIKESNCAYYENDTIYCVYDSTYNYLSDVIRKIYNLLGIKFDDEPDINRDRTQILKNYLSLIKEKSIVNNAPHLMKDWDTDANSGLNPEYITYASNQKVNWRCHKCGHRWQAAVYSRTNGNGCPACSGKVLVAGKNDLLSQNPKLALEWDYERNEALLPQEITVNNGQKVAWICAKCGARWMASVAHRNNGRGCPQCATEKMIKNRLDAKREKEGSLADNFPDIAKEWNYQKNGHLKPSDITSHSGEKVWWLCSLCSTEWEAYVSNRVKGHGCPTCFKKLQAERSVKSALKRNGPISISNPELLDKWDYIKNTEITPDQVSKGSHRKVWWKCAQCDHSWEAIVSNMVKGRTCPKCAKEKRKKSKSK